MTYLTDEASHLQPVELYQFTFAGDVWRFTDAEMDVVHPVTGFTYTPEPIWRGNLQQTQEDSSMSVEVTVDVTNPVSMFMRTPILPTNRIWLLIERMHVGSAATPAVLFRGQVAQIEFGGGHGVLTCIPTRQALNRSIPVQLIQQLCTNALYDQRCQANPNAFRQAATVASLSGIVMTVTGLSQPTGYYNGGFVEGLGKPPATIRDHNGGVLKLLSNPGYLVGDNVFVYAGCDHRLSTCVTKFNNSVHHQGFYDMPSLNPFTDVPF